MFKAKLIDNKDFYKLKNKHFWLLILPSIPIAILSNFLLFPAWLTALTVVCYIMLFVFTSKNQKVMNSMVGQNNIEIDENEIRIKSQKGRTLEVLKIENLEKIVLQKVYGIPQETMKDMVNEFKGTTRKNYLIIQKENKKRKFDFEIESHYMITQLNKIIDSWNEKGLKIEKV